MSDARTTISGLQIATVLYEFLEREALPGTGLDSAAFWDGFAALLTDFAPRNAALMTKRDEIQAKIDAWHLAHKGQTHDQAAYEAFLTEIGYLLAAPAPFAVSVTNVDDEIAHIAGPQLVVPVSNARYALNAANTRWGSLYDALYGTDALPETDGASKGPGFNKIRAAKVITRGRQFLDEAFPLATGSHADAHVLHSDRWRPGRHPAQRCHQPGPPRQNSPAIPAARLPRPPFYSKTTSCTPNC